MLEIGDPCGRRVGIHAAAPVQGIDRQARVVFRGQRLAQVHAAYFRIGAELQFRKIYADVTGRVSTKDHCFQIRQIHAVIVCVVAAVRGYVRRDETIDISW